MTPLSIRYKDTIAALRAMLGIHAPQAIERIIPGPLTSLAKLGQRCGRRHCSSHSHSLAPPCRFTRSSRLD